MNSQNPINAQRILDQIRWTQGMLDTIIEMQKPEYKKCAHDLGYLWFMTVDMFQALYGDYQSNGSDAGWDNVEDVFSSPDTISEISKSVFSHALLSNRKHIIEIGFKAHLDANYVASVSVLLPQIEGVVWDIGVCRGLVSPEPNSKRKMKGDGEWGFHDLVSEIWRESPSDSTYDRFLGKMKHEFYSKTLRHPVLHGRDVSQFNRRRSTEVIMLLWGVSVKA